jgi:hypothetical protein
MGLYVKVETETHEFLKAYFLSLNSLAGHCAVFQMD